MEGKILKFEEEKNKLEMKNQVGGKKHGARQRSDSNVPVTPRAGQR